jgi:WD40-like Beta Propeller Repeat
MRYWLLSMLCACGFRPSAAPGDDMPGEAGMQSEAPVTIDASPPTCFGHWYGDPAQLHFTTRHLFNSLASTATDRDPALSKDELQIWFASYRSPSFDGDVWTATRNSIGDEFGAPSQYAPANVSTASDGKLYMAGDQLSFVEASNRGTGVNALYLATRATTAEAFSPPSSTPFLNDNTAGVGQYDPWISDDQLRLYWAPTDTGTQHLAEATRTDTGSGFGSAVAFTEINSQGKQNDVANAAAYADITVNDQEKLAVYSAHRDDNNGGAVGSDLWFSTRATSTGTFSAPIHLNDVATNDSESDPWLSPDGCRLYFSARNGGDDFDIYEAEVVQ